MAKKNFYAVKGTVKPQIVSSWADCSRLVHGVKGAIFKGFVTRSEAEAFLNPANPVTSLTGQILAYVDGSFSEGEAYAGWGVVLVKDDLELESLSGLSPHPAYSRNIDGEVYAAIAAIKWSLVNEQPLIICHDYEGLAYWATGEWQAKSEIAKIYANFCDGKLANIRFKKVSAHSGDKWNDRADALAKQAIGLATAIDLGE